MNDRLSKRLFFVAAVFFLLFNFPLLRLFDAPAVTAPISFFLVWLGLVLALVWMVRRKQHSDEDE